MSALEASALVALLAACAPSVHPETMGAVVRVESGGVPWALNVNKAPVPPSPALSAREAARTAEAWIARGYSVDIGLAQVNSRNLPRLGLTAAQALDPCINVAAGARILAEGYSRAARERGEGQEALKIALSLYNTGSPVRGFQNGYIAKYFNGARSARPLPAAPFPRPPAEPLPAEHPSQGYAAEVTAAMGGLPE